MPATICWPGSAPWVDFDSGIALSCPVAQPVLPASHQPRQNQADGGTVKIKVNPTEVRQEMGLPVQENFIVGIYVKRSLLKDHDQGSHLDYQIDRFQLL